MKKNVIVISGIVLFIICIFTGCLDTSQENKTQNSTQLVTSPISTSQENSKSSNSVNYQNETGDLVQPTAIEEKITALFPKIIPESIKKPDLLPGFLIPAKMYFVYDNVRTTDGMSYEIRLDRDTEDLVNCCPTSVIRYPKAEKKISLSEAQEIAADFVKKVKLNSSENYLNDYPDDSFIRTYYTINGSEDIAYGSCVEYIRVFNGIRCYDSKIQIEVDSITGEVTSYYESWPDLSEYDFSSPEPDFSLENAKQLIMSTIEEKYPGEVKSIEYMPIAPAGDSEQIEPNWYDDGMRLLYEKDEPIDLVWALYFRPELKEDDQTLYGAIISAHSGEIYDFVYKDIRIYNINKYKID